MGPPGTPQRAARGFANGKADYLTGLRKIEGQVRGLQKMIESDAWCPDVVTQVGLITRALGLLPAPAWLARAPSRFYCICSSCQWIRMPAMAPKETRAGSGILRQRSRPSETAAMAAVGMSVMGWRPSTTTAPAMAPAAAAVAPLTKALIWGWSRCRMNQR